MSRPGAASGEDKQYRASPIVGGLEASMPPHMLDPSKSPELLNVVLNNNGVEKRGGFIPVIKQHPKLSSIRNRGHHGTMRVNNTTTSADSNVVIVPGAAYAGHRLVYETLNLGLALELFCEIDDLTQFHVGNQRQAPASGTEIYVTAGETATTAYRIRVRPIFSKGPAKRAYEGDGVNGPADNTAITWHSDNGKYWGPGPSECCMPWCVYLFQDTSGNWEFRVSWHSVHTASGGIDLLTIRMPYTTLVPRTGVKYHLIFSHAHGTDATFRVGVWNDDISLPTYYTATAIIDQAGSPVTYSDYRAPTATTPGPVQLFDCPQEFIAAPLTRSANRPPGLDLSASASANAGDYWFACKRFEGRAEDIVIWSTNRLSGAPSTLDRFQKLDFYAQADTSVVSYWSMAEEGRDYVKEMSGRGNHLYFIPSGPIYDPTLGSPNSAPNPAGSACWYFNGQTSYAIADLDRRLVNTATDGKFGMFQADGLPNWRYRLRGSNDVFTISGNTIANPTVVTVSAPHGVPVGAHFNVHITGSNSTPSIDDTDFQEAISTGASTFTLAVNVTVAGTAGTASGILNRESAFFQNIVLNNLAHGLEVTFWPDAIEPRFEQVIMEIHGVLRLAIDVDGKLAGYCRNDQTGTNTLYAGDRVVKSTATIVPGQRYSVVLYREYPGTTLNLIINGTLDNQTGPNAASANGYLMSGITIGMGAAALNARTNANAGAYPTTGSVASPTTICMDPRSGFQGRIESARIITGQFERLVTYKDEDDDDHQVPQKLLWQIPRPANPLNPTALVPEDYSGSQTEFPANLRRGIALVPEGKTVPITDTFYRDKELLQFYANTARASALVVTPAIASAENYGFDPVLSFDEASYGVLHGSLKAFHTVARWVLDKDDGETGYAGTYDTKLESTIDGGGTGVTYNPLNGTHVQLSNVTDEVGMLQHLQKRCTESDILSIKWTVPTSGTVSPNLRHSGRPYHYKSPRELAPTWAPGLIVPLTETNPISLIAEWQHQKSNESFLVLGCSRHLYWAKPVWRNDSPFPEVAPHSLWSFGAIGDYAKVNCSSLQQEFRKVGSDYTTVGVSIWVKPQRIDGNRILLLKGEPSTPRVNFGIGFRDGALTVFGSAGSNTRNWMFVEGTSTNIPPPIYRPAVALRDNAWNHVYVLIGSNIATGTTGARVDAWINGLKVPMNKDLNYDDITAASPDSSGSYPLYLMGLKPADLRVSLTGVGGSIDITWQPWHGLSTELRLTNAEEAAFLSSANFGFPPKARYSDSASTYLLMHLNEGENWSLANAAATTSATDNGIVQFTELITISNENHPLDESKDNRYDWVVFRDELLITNGLSSPRRLRFTHFSDAEGPFRCSRLGMEAPFSTGVGAIGFAKSGTTNNPANVYNVNGAYDLYISFLNDLDEESEPTLLSRYVFTGTSVPNPFAGFRLEHLPRSPDPQVRKRRIYISSTGGGPPLLHSDLNDNLSLDTQIYGLPFGDAVVLGDRLAAPKARLITVGSGTVFLGYLTESEAGSNAFAWSLSDAIAHYPSNRLALVDSTNGKAISGFRALRGTLYIVKRDSTWQFELRGAGNPAEAQASLQPISESVGMPGGLVSFDNLLYGTGERGPYAFNGSNHIYLGQALKDDYQALGLTQGSKRLDEAFLNTFGGFERPNSQYWLSVRQPDRGYNEFVYVLHTAVGDRQAWTKLQLPKHTYLQESTQSNAAQPGILIGTLSGQLLRYSTDVFIDGHGNTKQYEALTVLSGTVTSGTTTSLTCTLPAGQTFESIGNGLRGCLVRINGVDRVIERTSGATIFWRAPLQSAAAGVFYVGAYNSNWTTGWLELAKYGHWTLVRFIDLDFAPTSCTLTVENQVANTLPTNRAFPGGAESRTADLSTGYLEQPLPVTTANLGRYFRLRLSANLQQDQWLMTGIGLRYSDTGIRGKPT